MKKDLIFTEERLENYKKSVKQRWNETYQKEGYKAAHNAGSLEKTLEVALLEMDLFLHPTPDKCKLLSDKSLVPIPTFGPAFHEHKDICEYLGNDLAKCTALEYGCGYMARYAIAMADKFKDVYAIDVSAFALDQAKLLAKDKNNIVFVETNGIHLSLIDSESVDFVFSNLVFQHIGNKEVTFSITEEITRVLKPGGVLRAEYSNHEDIKDIAHQHVYVGNGFTDDEIKIMYEECGLSLETITKDRRFLWATGVKNDKKRCILLE